MEPKDFIDYKYKVFGLIDSPVYIEFIEWFLDVKFTNFDRSYNLVLNEGFLDKEIDYSYYNKIKNINDFTLDFILSK